MTGSHRAKQAQWYIRYWSHAVRGWLSRIDGEVLVLADRAQREAGIRGHLLEIGVFEGRSAILLGFLTRSGERLLTCDLFREPTDAGPTREVYERYYRGFSRRRFERNYMRFHDKLPDIFESPSRDLAAVIEDGSVRLVHIDGSHDYADVKNDLEIARRAAAPGAVVVVDDWRAGHSPGVAGALWEAVHNRALRLVAVTEAKAYASWDPARVAVPFRSLVQERFYTDVHRIAGQDVLVIAPSTRFYGRSPQELLARGAGSILARFARSRPDG